MIKCSLRTLEVSVVGGGWGVGVPELRLGLNDKVLFENTGSKCCGRLGCLNLG